MVPVCLVYSGVYLNYTIPCTMYSYYSAVICCNMVSFIWFRWTQPDAFLLNRRVSAIVTILPACPRPTTRVVVGYLPLVWLPPGLIRFYTVASATWVYYYAHTHPHIRCVLYWITTTLPQDTRSL